MIDWTKPLELMDGTPVRLTEDDERPDEDGDYWIEREDGRRIKSLDRESMFPSYLQLCVGSNGWEGRIGQLVRNRA